ncbi:MAG: hypothetical protein WB801_09340 [Candidatus Dormiibacterota bacterium]
MDEQVRKTVLEEDSEDAMALRFEIFMDELEAHADPAFGDGRMPEINRAARALMEALEAEFIVETEGMA